MGYSRDEVRRMNQVPFSQEQGVDPALSVYAALVDADWLPPKRNGTVDDVRKALRDANLLRSETPEGLTRAQIKALAYSYNPMDWDSVADHAAARAEGFAKLRSQGGTRER